MWNRIRLTISAATACACRAFRAGTARRRRLTIGRYRNPSDRPPPLHWTPCHPSTINRFKATMTCPTGHVITLRSHRINSNGLVMPSVVCAVKGCAFHAYVRLQGWTSGAVK